MTRRAAVILGLAGAVLAAAPAPPQSGPASAERLAWMSGCWERRSGPVLVEEQWMRPRGGTLLGMSRTVRGDSTVEHESMRIYEQGGRLVFAALPSGQAPAEFRSTHVGGAEVVFSNPAHDFPQTVRYRRAGADSLVARIEGTRGGRLRGVDFPMRRVPCAT